METKSMYRVNHGWLYGNVKPYFAKNGFNLLRDDMLFIEKCLSNIPEERHKPIMREYYALWNEQTGSRFEANTFLRDTCLSNAVS